MRVGVKLTCLVLFSLFAAPSHIARDCKTTRDGTFDKLLACLRLPLQVMIMAPTFLNGVQFWIQDNFLMVSKRLRSHTSYHWHKAQGCL